VVVALLNGLIDLLTASSWTYFLLFGICVGDAVFPAFPSETALIVCGIQAARGNLDLELVIVCGAAGAFVGDNLSYAAGRWLGQPVQRRFFSGDTAKRRLEWAQNFLKERGSYVLIVARFVPGGRTATTFTSGLVHMRWLMRFVPAVFVAAILWSVYGALLGYLGGKVFENHPILALLVALGIAATITVAVEGWRRVRD
jgi:membrane protein DedA with SNARE-associated domain